MYARRGWYPSCPASWRLMPLKYAVRSIVSGGTPDTSNLAYWSDHKSGIPWVAIGDMSQTDVVADTAKHITEEGRAAKNLVIHKAGTLLYSMYASVGKVSRLAIDAAINQAILAISVDPEKCTSEYLKWLLHYVTTRILEETNNNTQDNLNLQKVRNAGLLLPPLPEQSEIANFLDRETAKADALAAKYERLIELLEEKRISLITQSVTKGLHRNAPMKNTGAEWIGQIPSHWTMTRLKFISSVTVGIVVDPSSYFAPEGLPFIHGNNISDGFLNLDGVKYISPADSHLNFKSRLTAGDIVCMRVGEPGRSAVVTPECEGGNCASVLLFRKSPKFDSNWLRLFLNSAGRTQVLREQNGTAQQVLNVSQAINIWIPLPPIDEQRSIAEQMMAAEDRFLQQMDHASRAIDLLREHRAALVTAAVTGQIDVRTYKAKNLEEVVA